MDVISMETMTRAALMPDGNKESVATLTVSRQNGNGQSFQRDQRHRTIAFWQLHNGTRRDILLNLALSCLVKHGILKQN